MRFPDIGTLYRLSHWDGDTFAYRFEAEQTIEMQAVVSNFKTARSVLIEN
jgi:hypothetical protein